MYLYCMLGLLPSRESSVVCVAVRIKEGRHHRRQLDAATDVLVPETMLGAEAMELHGSPHLAARIQSAAIELGRNKIGFKFN